jgi:hypothetical protein
MEGDGLAWGQPHLGVGDSFAGYEHQGSLTGVARRQPPTTASSFGSIISQAWRPKSAVPGG